MDIASQFEELKNAKKTQETLDGLNELLSVAKKEKDSSLALDISLQIVEDMRYLRMHDQVISWLEKELDSDFFTRKEDCLKIIEDIAENRGFPEIGICALPSREVSHERSPEGDAEILFCGLL